MRKSNVIQGVAGCVSLTLDEEAFGRGLYGYRLVALIERWTRIVSKAGVFAKVN